MSPDEEKQFDEPDRKKRDLQSALAEVNHRIATYTKPLVDFMNAHRGEPGYAEALEAYKWAVYASAVHCQIALAASEITLTDQGLINTAPPDLMQPNYEQLYGDALAVMLRVQELAGVSGLDEVIRRAKDYRELCRVIHNCVRLADLMMQTGYTTDSGNALLEHCEKVAADATD